MEMKEKEYKYPNVISFFLILSPLIFSIITTFLNIANFNTNKDGVTMSAQFTYGGSMTTQANIYFFGIVCASLMVLFGNKNKLLYPIGVSIALVTTAADFFQTIIIESMLRVVGFRFRIIFSAEIIIASIVMFVSVMMIFNGKKQAGKVANVSAVIYIILIVVYSLGAVFIRPADGFTLSIGEKIISFLQNFFYINIPIAVYVLASHALATKQFANGKINLQ